MDESQVWDLLARGGGVNQGHFLEATGHSDIQPSDYSGLLDPAGAEELGRALAERLRAFGATVVMVWEVEADLILGFVVARELGCRLVRAYNNDGLVDYSPGLLSGDRAILVADWLQDLNFVRAIKALIENQGGSLVRIAVLMDRDETATADVTSLVSLADRLHNPGNCPQCRAGAPLKTVS